MVVNTRIESSSISDRGLSEKRPQNEDSFLEIPERGIFAVADGVGGAQAGEVASQMAMEILGEAFMNMSAVQDAEEVMRAALESANSAIHQMSNELAQLSKMATTVVALHLNGNIATIGHVGDSRLYRFDSEGTLFRETDDHSMVAEEVRAGRMTEEQAENHPGKNIISRALGAEPVVELELKTTLLSSDSTFLICSDGVTRHIGDVEIAELLGSGDDLQTICSRIKETCYDRGAEDNLTAVLVRVTIESPEPSMAVDHVNAASDPLVRIVDEEEATVASVRPIQQGPESQESDEDDLLEIDTAEFSIDAGQRPEPDVFFISEAPSDSDIAQITEVGDDAEPESPFHLDRESPGVDDSDHGATVELDPEDVELHQNLLPTESVLPEPAFSNEPQYPADEPVESFSMFGNSGDASRDDLTESAGTAGKILKTVGMLLIGGIIGLAAYHFLFVPAKGPENPPITEMKVANIPLSAFEENRREVDKDPAGFLAKFGANPQDCEDHYLVGRAHLLIGDYVKARSSMTEARNRLSEADPANAKTIAVDIAMAIAVLNDTTIQTNLRKEFEAIKAPSTTNSNANR